MADSGRTDEPTTNQSSEQRNIPPGPSSGAKTPAERQRAFVEKQTAATKTSTTDDLNPRTTKDVRQTFSTNDTPVIEPEVAGEDLDRNFDQKEVPMPGKEDKENPGEQVNCTTEIPEVATSKGDDDDLNPAMVQKPKDFPESISRTVASTAQSTERESVESKVARSNENLPAPRNRNLTANAIHRASNVSLPRSPPQDGGIVTDEKKASQAKSGAQTTPTGSTKKSTSPGPSSSPSGETRFRSVGDRFDLRATLNFTPRESLTSPQARSSPSQKQDSNAEDSVHLTKSESAGQNLTEPQRDAEKEISLEIDGPPRNGTETKAEMKPENEGTSALQIQPRIDRLNNSGERERTTESLKDVSVGQKQTYPQKNEESVRDFDIVQRSACQAEADRTLSSNEPNPNQTQDDSSLKTGVQESVKVHPASLVDVKDKDRIQDRSLQVSKNSRTISPEPMDLDSSQPEPDGSTKGINEPNTDGVVNGNAHDTHSDNHLLPEMQNTSSKRSQLSGEQKSTDMPNGLQQSPREQNSRHAKTEPQDAMDISPAQSKDKMDDQMDVSPVSARRDEPEISATRKGAAPSQAENARGDRKQSATVRNESAPTLGNHPPDSSKRKSDSPSPQRRKRERSPTVNRRNEKEVGLSRDKMVNRAFSGRVELSAYCGHRIVAHVDGQELRGWVLDADVSSLENRSTPGEQVKNETSNEGEEDGPPLSPDIRLKPRKVPVARRTRKVVPLSKDHAMDIDELGCAPGIITGSDVPKRSVIVIGAGIAGIAAARALSVRGFEVTVLEARGRLGGRIATDWSMGSPVDLGAAFIHGCYGNPLSEIAREADIRTYSPGDVGTLLYASGQRVSSSDDRHAESIWKALLRRSGTIARGSLMKHSSLDIALGKLLSRLKEEVVDGCSEEVTQLLGWHAANLEAACASDMRNLSAKHYDMDDKSGFSGSHKLVRDGYASIVHALAGELDVHYNSEVIAIQRDVPIHLPAAEKNNVQKGKRTFGSKQYQEALLRDVHAESQKSRSVRYLDGVKRKTRPNMGVSREQECTSQRLGVRVMVENGKEYVAESCIVTVPLGVLQKGDISFVPPLPPWKHDVIHNIGFGLVNKVVMRFDTPFWVDDVANDLDEDRTDCDGPDHIGRVSGEHGVFYMFLSLLRCIGAPILVAITSGRFAEHIERLSDEEVVGMALKALRHMFPTRAIGTLLSHSVTRWKTDKYARGSYSYAKVGTTPQDYSRMSEPIGTLCFAGEATHRNHPATAHGAFMSGIREAARLIERSDLSEQERRKYARELFLMQEPHATFEKAVTCNGGAEMGNGHIKSESSRRNSVTNGNTQGIGNGTSSRKKRRSQSTRV